MIPKLYEGTETSFTSNGLGSLADAISCVVTEERNGVYELEMEYPVGGLHYDLLQNGRIIYAKPNETSNPQPFDIKEITPSMDNMTATIYAQHIRYRLNGIPVGSFSTTGIADALSGLVTNSLEKHSFTTWTDIENTTTKFEVTTPKAFGSLLGGSDGSILDTFSGSGSYSYEFDKFKIKLWHSRGADNGVSIRYAKNLTGCKMESSVEGVYTGVLAYYEAEDTIIKSAIQYVDNHSSYPHESIYLYDCTDEYDDETPTVAQLNEKAKSYLKTNKLGEPSVSIEVNFVPLWQTEEYKNVAPLERVSLCDTVKVVFNKLGVNASAMVNKTEYDVLAERYDKITLGSVKSNMASTVKQMVNDATSGVEEATMSKAQSAINSAVERICGGTNGHVVLKTNANGETNELYAYDGDTLESASKVLRLNYEGIAGTNNGLNGKYNLAITTDGQINANQITVGVLDGSIIKANSITTDKLTLVFGTTTTMAMQANSTGVEFVGTGTFTNKSVGEINLSNYESNSYSKYKNRIYTTTNSGEYGLKLENYNSSITNSLMLLGHIGSVNTIELKNYMYDNSYSSKLANQILMKSVPVNSSQKTSYISISNYWNSVEQSKLTMDYSVYSSGNSKYSTTVNLCGMLNNVVKTKIGMNALDYNNEANITISVGTDENNSNSSIELSRTDSSSSLKIKSKYILMSINGSVRYLYFDSNGYVKATTSTPY